MRFHYALLLVFCLAFSGCAPEPRGPRYLDVKGYSEGLAPAQSMNGKWGFINERQQWVIRPIFHEVREFKEGKAAAKINNKWGFINTRGQWI